MKQKINLLVMWITALGQASVTLYIPSFPAIANNLKINPAQVKTTLTLFLLGYGISQLFYGPLSDRYGRKPLLLIGIGIFCLGCFMNIFADNLTFFLLARLVQGLGVGSVITLGRAILRDCFSGRELSSSASYLSMGFAIGLGLTPIIGAYLQTLFGWQADFIFLLIIGLIFLILLWKWLPETLLHPTKISLKKLMQHTLREYKNIISNQVFILFLLGGILAYGVVIAYNVMTPFLIQSVLLYSTNVYGWLAILIGIPYFTAAALNRKLVLKLGSRPIIIIGIALILIAGLSMILTYYFSHLSLSVIIIPFMIATFGQALIWPNAVAGALQDVSQIGKASALLSGMQMLLVSVLSAAMALLPEQNQLPLGIVLTILGLLSGLFLWKEMVT